MDDIWQSGALISLDADHILFGYGPRTWFASQPTNTAPSWYVPDFFLSAPRPWFQHANYEKLSLQSFIDRLSPSSQLSAKLHWHQTPKTIFQQAFDDLQTAFESGQLLKGVPYIFSVAEFSDNRDQLQKYLFQLLKYAQNQSVFIYGFWDETQGMLGATPEKLFTIDSQQKILQTVAVAGTSDDKQQKDLLNDPKELHEHNLVIEGIMNSLAPFGKVTKKQTQVLKLPRLSHLCTPIKAVLDQNNSYESIVRALHPTPALGAYPKKMGESWLKAYHDIVPRARYGAPFGLIWPEKNVQECLVAIRNIQWVGNQLTIGAGCGVVVESQLEQEWQELQGKVQAIKGMFGL